MKMIFEDNDDLRACLEAIRDHLEAIPEHGPEGAAGFFDRLAGDLRTELSSLIVDPLDTPADCASLFHRYRGDDYVLALVRALARVLDVKTRLARPARLPAGRPWSCVTWGEVAEELQAAFVDVLSQQAQANERILAAKEESRRKGARRGGQKSKAAELKGIMRLVLQSNPHFQAQELWTHFGHARHFKSESDGKKFTIEVIPAKVRTDDDMLTIYDTETGEEKQRISFKTFQYHFTTVRPKHSRKTNPDK